VSFNNTHEIENIAKLTANLPIRKVAENIVTGVYKLGDIIVDGAKLLVKTVDECLTLLKDKIFKIFKIFKPFWNLVEKIKTKIMNYLIRSELFRTLVPFAQCFIGLKKAQNMIKTLFTIVNFLQFLALGVGWPELCINLFCGWRQVKVAIEWLMRANDEPDPLEAYSHHGKFAAHLMQAVAGA